MKNKTNFLPVIALLVFVSFGVSSLKAQTNPNHIFHVSTSYMMTGMDSSSRAERDAILQEYHEKVTMKNQYVLHQWTMTHFFTEDSREFVTISEFAAMSDIEKSFDRDDELEKLAWPDAKKRAEFMKKMNGYFTYHKDAIFNGYPKLVK
jgi:hypothetical protein